MMNDEYSVMNKVSELASVNSSFNMHHSSFAFKVAP